VYGVIFNVQALPKKNALQVIHVKGVCSSYDALFSATRPSFSGSVVLRPRITTGLLLSERYVGATKKGLSWEKV
jgi:hypothetical protein